MKISMLSSYSTLLCKAAARLAVLLALSLPFAAQVADDTNWPEPGPAPVDTTAKVRPPASRKINPKTSPRRPSRSR